MPFDFRYKTLDDVREDLLKLGINLPLSDDLSPLARKFTVNGYAGKTKKLRAIRA